MRTGVARKESVGGVNAPRYYWSVVVKDHMGWVMVGMWTLGGIVGTKGTMPKDSHQSGVRKMPKKKEK